MNSREYAKFKRTFVGPILKRKQRLAMMPPMPAEKIVFGLPFINSNKPTRIDAMKQATPKWANQKTIKEFYSIAKKLTENLGVPHHVDHIIPLQNEFVCGLHVENNLQILRGTDNLQKGNSFIIE
jgi:hypothetical protein